MQVAAQAQGSGTIEVDARLGGVAIVDHYSADPFCSTLLSVEHDTTAATQPPCLDLKFKNTVKPVGVWVGKTATSKFKKPCFLDELVYISF